MNTTDTNEMTNAMIKCLPQYKYTKLQLTKLLHEAQLKEQENKAIIEGLTKELELSNNAVKGYPSFTSSIVNNVKSTLEVGNTTPAVNPPVPNGLPIMLEPEPQQLEDKSEIEGLWKINNELQQENEEFKQKIEYLEGALKEESGAWGSEVEGLKKEKKYLIEKLNNIEKVLVAFRVLVNNEAGGLGQYC